MQVKMSEYLTAVKPDMQKLVELLKKDFAYVSVLCTDVTGTTYLVGQRQTSVGDYHFNERGFVVRVYENSCYMEYSFNEYEDIEKLASTITETLKKELHMMEEDGEQEPVEIVVPGEYYFRNGSHYADRTLHRIPNELTASPLAVHTLSAVRDYIESGADECAEDEDSIGRRFVIHVADYDRVYLYRELNSDKARECLLEAELSAPTFPFGRWLGVEEFIINMQTHFVPTEVRDTLVQLISTVTTENGVSLADDGMTQRVTARSGISLVKQVSVPNPVVLAPYRTFTEVEQPKSPFVFRIRQTGDEVQAALFAADADAWIS